MKNVCTKIHKLVLGFSHQNKMNSIRKVTLTCCSNLMPTPTFFNKSSPSSSSILSWNVSHFSEKLHHNLEWKKLIKPKYKFKAILNVFVYIVSNGSIWLTWSLILPPSTVQIIYFSFVYLCLIADQKVILVHYDARKSR